MSGHHVQSRLRFCQTLFNDHRLIFAALLKGYRIERFQKIPNTIPWMAFRNSKGKREFFELGIQRHGGYLRLEFRRHGGVQDLEFPQGTDKSVFLENTFLENTPDTKTTWRQVQECKGVYLPTDFCRDLEIPSCG